MVRLANLTQTRQKTGRNVVPVAGVPVRVGRLPPRRIELCGSTAKSALAAPRQEPLANEGHKNTLPPKGVTARDARVARTAQGANVAP